MTQPQITEGEFVTHMRDPEWRLCHLYRITSKDGQVLVFKPNRAQRRLLDTFWFRNLVLKARQRGFSTLIQLMMLDRCLFNENIRAAVIAQDKDSTNVIFRDKIKFAYDRLPDLVKEWNPLIKDSESELLLSNNSSLRVATSVRSGTLQFLHVSEFGKICAKYPDKAREVMTGSLPAVDQGGMVFIESTAEGREGAFYDMTREAQAIQDAGKELTPLDMKFHFAGWWDADEYEADPALVVVTDRDRRYFEQVESKIKEPLSDRKRAWYVKKLATDFAGDAQMMMQEYPSTPDEAFSISTEGTYYAIQMAAARREGRICRVPHQQGVVVNTFWDLGQNDETSIWFHQRVGPENRFIDFYEAAGEPFEHFIAYMQRKGWVWGESYLPHDAEHIRQLATTNKSARQMLEDLHLRNIVVVPRIDNILTGIQQTRDAFGSSFFDEEACRDGLVHLDLYRKEWNDRLGVWKDTPRHDAHSNAADAFRQFGQGYRPSLGGGWKRKPANHRTI